MTVNSQLEIEEKFSYLTSQSEDGTPADEVDFGTVSDWMLSLGGETLVLHPGLKRWVWYDNVHEQFTDTGLSTDEAIFVPIPGFPGVQYIRLSKESLEVTFGMQLGIGQLYLYHDATSLHGPFTQAQLREKLSSVSPTNDVFVWNAKYTEWQSPGELGITIPASGSSGTVTCASCGVAVDSTYSYCPYCGTSVSKPARSMPPELSTVKKDRTVYCRKCGRPMRSTANFCPACGTHRIRED